MSLLVKMPVTTRLRSGAGKRRNYRKMAGGLVPRRRRFTTGRKLSKPVATAVKKVVRSLQETKYVSHIVENAVAHNSPISAGDFYRVLPIVTAGPAEWNRIGDKIRPVALTVKGQVGLVDAADNKPIMVRILILQLKSAHYWAQAQAGWAGGAYNALLKLNDEAGLENIPYGGDAISNFVPVNRENFDVLGERFIMLNQQMDGSIEASSPGTLSKTFSFRVKTPATLGWGAAGNQYPENFAPFMTVGYSYMDGTAPDTVQTPVIVTAHSHLYYKDA